MQQLNGNPDDNAIYQNLHRNLFYVTANLIISEKGSVVLGCFLGNKDVFFFFYVIQGEYNVFIYFIYVLS